MFKFLTVWVLFVAVAFGDTRRRPVGKGHAASSNITMKILNGVTISIDKIPHHISLGSIVFFGPIALTYKHFCGGSIISEYWVVTAAHCFNGRSSSNINTILSGSSLNNGLDSSWHTINRKIIHPQFYVSHNAAVHNDIALISVVQPFVFGPNRKRALIYGESSDTLLGKTAMMSGWGEDGFGKYPSVLHFFELTIVAKSVCELDYGYELSGQICGKHNGLNQGVCRGDSGSPLTVDGALVGIHSTGPRPCTDTWRPSIYTDVGYYSNWIIQTLTNKVLP